MKRRNPQALAVARDRVSMAKLIGWPALEQSWQRDVDRLIAAGGEKELAASYLRKAARSQEGER
jgi:hypothetical protein